MLGKKEIYCTTGENMLFLITFSTDHYQSDDATDSAASVSMMTIRSIPIPNPTVVGVVLAQLYQIVFGYSDHCLVERTRISHCQRPFVHQGFGTGHTLQFLLCWQDPLPQHDSASKWATPTPLVPRRCPMGSSTPVEYIQLLIPPCSLMVFLPPLNNQLSNEQGKKLKAISY